MPELRFEVLFKAIDDMSVKLDRIAKGFAGVNEQVERGERMKQYGENLVGAGVAMGAAGAAGAFAIKGMVDQAEDFQDHLGRLGAAMGNIPDKAAMLSKAEQWIKKFSIESGYAVDDVTESLYQGLSGFLNLDQSMAVATESAKLARGTQGDLADTTKLMTTAMLNFGDAHKTPIQNATILADKLAALQTQYKFTSLNDLTEAMKHGAPTALAYNVSLDQTLGALAALSAGGKTGGEAGVAYQEVIGELVKKAPKLGVHIAYTQTGQMDLFKTLDEVQKKFGSTAARQMLTEELGLRAGPALQLILQHMDKKAATDGVAHSTGAATAAEQNFEERGTLAWQKVAQAIHVIWIDLGEALEPTLTKIANKLTDLGKRIHGFIEAHPQLVKYVMIFAAIGSAVLLVVGGLVALAGGILILGSFFTAFGGIALAALLALPVAIAAVAYGAYELYKHWGAVKGFFVKLWADIKGIFEEALAWIVSSGVNLVKGFVSGILSVAALPGKAIAKVLSVVRAHLPFSPAEVGPLRDLNRVRIVETIADRIRPAPIVNAMRGVAAATMMAAPLIGAPSIPGPSGTGETPSRAMNITVHYEPKLTVNGGTGSPEEFAKVLYQHRNDVVRIIRDAHFRERSLQFE